VQDAFDKAGDLGNKEEEKMRVMLRIARLFVVLLIMAIVMNMGDEYCAVR
jgi:hypothetical protein